MISIMKWNDLCVPYTKFATFVKLLNANYKGPREIVRVEVILN